LNFRDLETGLAKDLIVLVGKNGSGKSTVLQSIAAMLGAATGRLKSPADLDWPGFDLALANKAWQRPLSADLEVGFTADEVQATQDFFERTYIAQDPNAVRPGRSSVVKLRLDPETQLVWAGTRSEFYQFHGRDYARIAVKHAPEGFSMFKRVGTVFWYTEHRTTNSLTPTEANGEEISFDLNLLRRRLSDYMVFHERIRRNERKLRIGERDLFAELEKAYQAVFPTRRLDGPVPQAEIDNVLAEPWFYLYDSFRSYELSEMSGGERAIFPMLFDFANWNIHNSVILIDEFELHLHPPLQQGLLKALRNLGENNQFIITTHSDAVAEVVPEQAIYRLEAA
jgi:predicted ATP-dependent endonuclease of OLD family